MNKNKKVKLIALYNDTDDMESISMQIIGKDDAQADEHTLEELDLVTTCFSNKEKFIDALIETKKIDSRDVDLFIADKYSYKGERIRMTNVIYKSYLTKHLSSIALDRLEGKEIDIDDSKVIIANFTNLIDREKFRDLCINTQVNPLNNKMRRHIAAREKNSIWAMATSDYRILRDMVSMINDYYRLIDDKSIINDIESEYSKNIIKREKRKDKVSELLSNKNYGKQIRLSKFMEDKQRLSN